MTLWDGNAVKVEYKSVAPTGADAGFPEGYFWLDQVLDRMYQLMDVTAGVATWREVGGGGGSLWIDQGIVTLSTGVLDASAGPGIYTVASEAGSADAMTQVTGLAAGECIRIQPDTGDTITVTDGAKLDLQGVNFPMESVKDIMELMCSDAGNDVSKEVVRADNT